MNRFAMLLVVMFVAAFAVAGVQQKEMPAMPKMDMQMMKDCPMALPGTSFAASDTTTGIAVNVTAAQSDNVPELRRRVERMAAMHRGDFSTSYELIEKGARVTLTPKDPEKVAELRSQVQAHVEQMKKGGCSMMQGAERKRDSAKPQGMMGKTDIAKPEPKAEPKKDETDHSGHHPEGKQ